MESAQKVYLVFYRDPYETCGYSEFRAAFATLESAEKYAKTYFYFVEETEVRKD